jgi:hypothetical protein
MAGTESQCSGEGVNRHDLTITTHRRRRRSDRDLVEKRRDNDSLFGVLSEGDDGNNAAGVQSVTQRVSNPFRRNSRGTASLTIQRSTKRHRPASAEYSSSNESDWDDRFTSSRNKAARLSLSQPYRRRRRRFPHHSASPDHLPSHVERSTSAVSLQLASVDDDSTSAELTN